MTGLATGEGGTTGLAAGASEGGTATAAQSIAACWLLYEAHPAGTGHQRDAGGDAVVSRDLLPSGPEGETPRCHTESVRATGLEPEGETPRGHSESVGATGAAPATSAIEILLMT